MFFSQQVIRNVHSWFVTDCFSLLCETVSTMHVIKLALHYQYVGNQSYIEKLWYIHRAQYFIALIVLIPALHLRSNYTVNYWGARSVICKQTYSRHYGANTWLYFPSVFWISHSDCAVLWLTGHISKMDVPKTGKSESVVENLVGIAIYQPGTESCSLLYMYGTCVCYSSVRTYLNTCLSLGLHSR